MKPEILLDPNTPSSHQCVQSTDLTSHPGELELGKRIGRGVARSSQVGRGSCTLRFSESISGSVASGSKTPSKDGQFIDPFFSGTRITPRCTALPIQWRKALPVPRTTIGEQPSPRS